MFNLGDIFDTIDSAINPESPALLHGDRTVSWGGLAKASNNLAQALVDGGAQPGDKLAIYMRNCPEYAITLVAALKARMVPVNVNYRYARNELLYLFDNADAQVIVYDEEFRPRIDEVRGQLSRPTRLIELGTNSPPDFAESFAALTDTGSGAALAIERSPDDLLFIYTGGTTGMPKGVMWPHGDLREVMVAPARELGPIPETLDQIAAFVAVAEVTPRILPAPPLMHGTGLIVALGALLFGGSVVTLTSKSFDAAEMLEAIGRHRPAVLAIVGDSFGRPLLEELEANPTRYDLSSVESITSSGVMWSLEVKRGLLKFMPNAVMNDFLSSSEALGLGTSVMTADGDVPTARFELGPRCRLLGEDGSLIEPAPGARGQLALGPPNPLGYYRDEAKTAATFHTIDGVRYCVPGDWCEVAEDGSLTFLGRGSACINSAGEKIFPEEVEEALKRHASVADALVVGVPDPKWGEAIVGVVALRESHALDSEALRDHVRNHLAGYKVPKALVLATSPLRAANGKADYATAKALATEQLT